MSPRHYYSLEDIIIAQHVLGYNNVSETLLQPFGARSPFTAVVRLPTQNLNPKFAPKKSDELARPLVGDDASQESPAAAALLAVVSSLSQSQQAIAACSKRKRHPIKGKRHPSIKDERRRIIPLSATAPIAAESRISRAPFC
jgi:hypothetical protein